MLSEKIVVIDDDTRVIQTIKLALVNYEVVEFLSALEALDYLRKPNEINLVLLDVMMPGMDGIAALQEIRKINKDVAVIIMTAYGSKEVVIQALQSQANDFIEKPFDIDELNEKVGHLLKQKMHYSKSRRDKNGYVDRIKRFVDRNFNNVNLEYISNEMCLSPKYVSRMFNSRNDCGFRDYKVKVKIDRAKELLKGSSLNVSEISFELGYQNPESFMRIFKRMTKQTPMQYRKGCKNGKKSAVKLNRT